MESELFVSPTATLILEKSELGNSVERVRCTRRQVSREVSLKTTSLWGERVWLKLVLDYTYLVHINDHYQRVNKEVITCAQFKGLPVCRLLRGSFGN